MIVSQTTRELLGSRVEKSSSEIQCFIKRAKLEPIQKLGNLIEPSSTFCEPVHVRIRE